MFYFAGPIEFSPEESAQIFSIILFLFLLLLTVIGVLALSIRKAIKRKELTILSLAAWL